MYASLVTANGRVEVLNCYLKCQEIPQLSAFWEEALVSRLEQVTPWSKVLFEELTANRLVKPHIFHGTRKLSAAFTRARY